ncbi:MAG: hypothetical protein EOO11_07130 [Chitinophagaceae bacterium]|nr:MAG: hypothetical protein EOO11_07130 [Chitinophagaceae bacterium]
MNAMQYPTYTYLGDRHTDPALKGISCTAVRRADGKCIRGRNGSMLVQLADGRMQVLPGRLLRKQAGGGS